MKVPSFLRLFGKGWFGNTPGRRQRRKAARPRHTEREPLHCDRLEDRTLLATLPTPLVLGQTSPNALFNSLISSGGHHFTPAVAVDPLDPMRAVTVFSRRIEPAPMNPPRIVLNGLFTTNGGLNWQFFAIPSNLIDPTSAAANPQLLDHATNATIGFDRFRNFFITVAQHDADPPYASKGAIVFHRFDMSSGVPVKVALPGEDPFFPQGKTLYSWTANDSGVTPYMVVDSTVAQFVDPDTGQIQSNPSAGTIYVAFATSNTAPQNQGQGFNPNVLRLVASSDGGQSFGSALFPASANQFFASPYCANFSTIRCGSPRLTVSQGTADGRVPGGTVNLVWEDFSQNNVTNADNRFTILNTVPLSRGVGLGFSPVQALPREIIDGSGTGAIHTPGVTDFTIQVNITHAGFVRLSDLDVTLALSHANLSELLVQLIAPTGEIITLFTNRTLANGMQLTGMPPPGLTGANLGWLPTGSTSVGTRFDTQAARSVADASSAVPHAHYVRPEFGGLDFFNGRTAAQLNGTWTLRITDHRTSPPMGTTPAQRVHRLELNMTSGLEGQNFFSTGFVTPVLSSLLPPYPQMAAGANPPAGSTDPTVYQDVRFNPAPVLASDNTLGSFSQFQGRLYLAYAHQFRSRNAGNEDINPPDNLDILLHSSDDGGRTWSFGVIVNDDFGPTDGFSGALYLGRPIAGRPQFLPQLAVDQSTGTLVVSFFDARYDAARARVSTTITTSIDGGSTFSPQTFVNPARQVVDAATGQQLTLEPFADNFSNGYPLRETAFGAGRLGLAAQGGFVYPIWSSNANAGRDMMTAARLGIRTLPVRIGTGPRIIRSTMGQVQSTTVDGTTFNNTFHSDGTRLADGFVAEFDRPVEPASFTQDVVSVTFRSPTTPATSPGIQLDVLTVLQLNAGLFGPARAPGATRFLIRFDPTKALLQSGSYVGTYSYAVRPLVRDRIRIPGVTVIPTGTTNYPAPPSQINLRIPPTGTGGLVNDVTRSLLSITGVPTNQSIFKVTVNLSLRHTFDADLVITLVHPDGTRILLSDTNGGSGQDYINTTFDDAAAFPIFFFGAPFTGRFRPEQRLGLLNGKGINGTWTLEIRDQFAADIGTLLNWSLEIESGIVIAASTASGNRMDQDADATQGEDPGDVYAVPRPLGGVPGRPPYDTATLPLIVPGPRVISTRVPGAATTPDNLVLNATASAIDVVFDRDMNLASFTPAQILRMMGPAGLISGPFTVSANPTGTDPALARRTFRIGFPTQQLSGTYTITLGSGLASAAGDLVDANQNAGLDVLRDVAAPGTTNAPVTFTSNNRITLATDKTTTSFLDVPDNFVVQGATVQLNITHPNDPNLSVTLIAPDGAEVRLFSKVGNSGTRQNFVNTILDDAATAAIQRGDPPFNGSFTPQEPLARMRNRPAGGRWTLRIQNDSATLGGTLTNWSLTLLKAVPNSGLGEPVADQTPVSFRLFTLSNTNPLSKSVWTAVGPAPIGSGPGNQTGRIGGLALDPSDPSGNTIYVAGASGGIWKTTNFLTTAVGGPTYIPLTDFGPSFGINIGGLAIVGRNNDTRQSIVFAATGEGDTFTFGVGALRSFDGGTTWTVLDSTRNVDANGNVLPMSSPLRDHIFARATAFKIVADPRLGPNGEAVVYMAISDATGAERAANRAGGIWRSIDSGKTWERVRPGQATDVVLAPQTPSDSTGNLQVVYAAFFGEGVFISPNQGSGWQLMTGTVGNPLIRDGDFSPSISIPVQAPAQTPNGAKGRISLAVPDRTGDRALDTIYAGWVYAVVSTQAGGLDGVYLTKDFGQNWTHVRIPATRPRLPGGAALRPSLVGPTNDTRDADNNLLLSGGSPQGSYNMSIVVDPNNPNIVYVGGADGDGAAPSPNKLIRIDTTFLHDPHAELQGTNQAPDGGLQFRASIGSVNVRDNRVNIGRYIPPFNFLIDPTQYVNLIRDPDNIFLNDSTMFLSNVTRFNNTGAGAKWTWFSEVLEGSVDQHRVFAFRDPLTGRTRLVFGDDQGVFSGVDRGDGQLLRDVGGVAIPTGTRNGNLQITQFYYGASQPSILAAEIAGSLFYGTNQDTGYPKSTPDILRTGNLVWRGPGGDGTGVATDQTGSGTSYAYLWPCCGGQDTNFFRVAPVFTDPLSVGIGRTFGLLQQNLPGQTPDPQWPFAGGFNLAVNPLSGNQAIIGSAAGRLFRTQNQALTWFEIGPPAELDGSEIFGLAYGAPNPAPPGQQGNLDDFIYVGTQAGRIFVTFTGGGGQPGTRWRNISAGLNGASVQAIVTNPLRGSKEAIAVTTTGVFYMADSSAPNATWVNISGNLFNITHDPFGDSRLRETRLKEAFALAADWRYADGAPNRRIPVLYVGGEGGVFRSSDRGRTWRAFPDTGDGSPVAGGYLPNAKVTDLDLVLGNVNPTTGKSDEAAGFNLLMASTFGRGVFAIRLPDQPNKAPFSGPRVTSVDPGTPVSPGFNSVTLTFSGPVDPDTLTATAIRSFLGPVGNVGVTSIQDLQDPITRQPPHTKFRINFTGQLVDGVYTLILGPAVTDFSGNAMNQNANDINGEEPNDRFTVRFVINTSDNGRFITGLFNDVLRRQSDTEGFLQYIDVVDAARAQALGPVARFFVSSMEGRARLISEYYQTTRPTVIGNFLRRPASLGEINAWVSFLNSGGTPQQAVAQIVSSAEYFQKVGNSNLAFLNQLYSDLLGRGIDLPGRDGFLNLLDNLATDSRRGVIDVLNRSGEYYGNLVRGIWSKYLGRGIGQGDVNFWVGQLSGGTFAERVITVVVGSAEYYARKGGNDGAWVDGIFTDVLGRPADPAGRAALLAQLAAGFSRDTVAFGVLQSDEYRGTLIRDYYSRFLGRNAGQGDLNAWLPAFKAGLSDEQVISLIMSSPEYLGRAGGTNTGFVDKAYRDLLGRGADPAGRDALLLNLAQSQSGARATIAGAITGSPEYSTRIIVTTYQTVLQRGAGSAEINIWLPLLQSSQAGAPGSVSAQEQFVGTVYASGEYFFQNGNTNRSWVASIYNNILGRPGSPPEVSAVLNQVLDFFGTQRFGVSETFIQSTESRTTFIRNAYQTYLRRAPLDQEIQNWLTLFRGGLKEEQMVGVMVGSAEYFLRQAGNDVRQFIDKAYQDLLGRARGTTENFLLDPLVSGAITRQQAVDTILSSQEYRRRVVADYFRTYLSREAGLGEVDALVFHLNQGARQSQVLATVLASSEYYLRTHPYP